MLARISEFLTIKLIDSGAISKEDYEIYTYGWAMILSTLAIVISILFLSIIAHNVIATILYLACFLMVRAYAGGSHADSYFGCYISSLTFYCVPLIFASLTDIDLSVIFIRIFAVMGVLLIFARAPQDHPNRKLSNDEVIMFRRKSRIIACTFGICIFISTVVLPQYLSLSWWSAIGLLEAGITLLKSNKDD